MFDFSLRVGPYWRAYPRTQTVFIQPFSLRLRKTKKLGCGGQPSSRRVGGLLRNGLRGEQGVQAEGARTVSKQTEAKKRNLAILHVAEFMRRHITRITAILFSAVRTAAHTVTAA